MNKIKAIAIHLPQFHPFPENSAWWGTGFTEWTNVTKARPLFKGHHQPHLPSDMGFYDLRLEETRLAQIALAKQYGLYGFCYYHYWFNGKRLMNEPVDRMLGNPRENFPFMFCWANETWSRRWLGEEKEILIKQTYNEADDVAHAIWLCENAFADSRYITIEGRPAFLIYRPLDLPQKQRTIDTFKNTAVKLGLKEPYLVASNSRGEGKDFEGFDFVMSFEPKLGMLRHSMRESFFSIERLIRNAFLGVLSPRLKVYDYQDFKRKLASRKYPYKFFPCVFVGWDNTARRGDKGIIVINQTPEVFRDSLLNAKAIATNNPPEQQIVFINAWNEWAEGNHLEPDIKDGHKYLEIVKEVFHD